MVVGDTHGEINFADLHLSFVLPNSQHLIISKNLRDYLVQKKRNPWSTQAVTKYVIYLIKLSSEKLLTHKSTVFTFS